MMTLEYELDLTTLQIYLQAAYQNELCRSRLSKLSAYKQTNRQTDRQTDVTENNYLAAS